MANLPNLVKAKTAFLDRTSNDILIGLDSLDDQIRKLLIKVLDDLDRRSGALILNESNAERLIRLNKEVGDVLKSKKYQSVIDKYLASFDRVDEFTAEITKDVTGTGVAIKSLVNPARTAIVDMVGKSLGSPVNIDSQVTQPIQRILFKHLLTGTPLADARAEINTFIGQDATRGPMARWAGQLAKDSLFQYDGAVQKEVATAIELDAFFFVGGIQDNSRPGCIHMVGAPDDVKVPYGSGKSRVFRTEVNRFKDIVLPGGGFRLDDIPKIIARNSGDRGWNPATTPESYLMYRNGYNCNHQAIPYKIPK